jgi:hypothetical protein
MRLDPMHALSEPIIETVRAALDEGVIVGLIHPIWSGPYGCAFATLDAYLESVQKDSDPGYLFTMWSVPALERQGVLLLRGPTNDLSSIRGWLHAENWREYLAVGMVDATPNVAWGDIDNFDELVDLARRADPRDEFAVLPLSELWDGGSYSPRLYLINAERANERGEVPSNKAEAATMRRRINPA